MRISDWSSDVCSSDLAGGGRWIALQSRFALAELRRRLVAREAPLVELIRDAESDTPGVDLVVAWRLEDELNLGRDGVERVRLRLYDPRPGAAAVGPCLTLEIGSESCRARGCQYV